MSLLAWIALVASSAHAGITSLPTSVSGGTGTLATIQANDMSTYNVARGQTTTISGFGAFGGAITSVYLFVEYTPDSKYAGTAALRINGVDTPIVPAAGDRTRSAFLDITGGTYGIDTSPEITSLAISFHNNGTGGQAGPIKFDYMYLVINPTLPIHMPPTWSDEFEGTGPPDSANWVLEEGYKRNNELQYYMTGGNAWQESGSLVIEARREPMGGYEYTSASLRSVGKYSWMYGRAQIRAKIPALAGMWPAIWQVGDVGEWPGNGECDIMEFYQEKILANCAVGTDTRWVAKWDGSNRTMSTLEAVDPNWRTNWHIWTIQWDENNVRLYCDNILMNTIPQSWLVNITPRGGAPVEPFKQPHNIWLNLAVGGAGGNPSNTTFPQRYHVDYWRVWEGHTNNSAPTDIHLSASGVGEALPVGTVVGNLSVTDPDPAEVIKYTLVTGTGSTHNSQFSIPTFQSDSTDTLVLKTNAVLNYADGATRSIRVRATDIEGATFDKVLTIHVAAVPVITPYESWAARTFANPFTLATRGADPDGDDVTNLMEFAFGTDPTAGHSGPLEFMPGEEVMKPGLPVLMEYNAPPGNPPFQAVFGRRKNHVAAGLTYGAEFSANLLYWSASNDGLEVLSGEGGHEIEVVAVPFPANVPLSEGGPEVPPNFFRVRVASDLP